MSIAFLGALTLCWLPYLSDIFDYRLLTPSSSGCGDGYYRDRNGYCRYRGDRWGGWGRWVVLAAVLVGAFFIFFAFA